MPLFMVNRNLLRQFDLSESELQQELHDIFDRPDIGSDVEKWLPPEEQDFEVNKIVKGRVVNIVGDDVVVDVGYKSEGIIPLQEWYDEGDDKVHPPQVGDEIEVLLDAVEDEGGAIVLSYRKAKRQKEWEDVIAKHKEGDVVCRPGDAQDQGRSAGQHRRQRLPAGLAGGHPPAAGHRRLHRQDHRVQDPQDRRGAAQHRRQPPQAARGPARGDEEEAPRRDRGRARFARASSRTSPSSAPSSISAASTACCTSPT